MIVHHQVRRASDRELLLSHRWVVGDLGDGIEWAFPTDLEPGDYYQILFVEKSEADDDPVRALVAAARRVEEARDLVLPAQLAEFVEALDGLSAALAAVEQDRT